MVRIATSSTPSPSRSATAAQIDRVKTATLGMIEAGEVQRAIETWAEIVTSMQQDNDRLIARWKLAVRARFGRRSEKLNAEELGQLVLALGGTEKDAAQPEPLVPVPAVPSEDELEGQGTPPAKKRRRKRQRTVVDTKVPRTVTVVPVPDDQRQCIHCDQAMTTIDYVDYERIEFHPARFEVLVRRCEKIACKHCKQDICTAEAPSAEQAFADHEATTRLAAATTQDEPTRKPSADTAEGLQHGVVPAPGAPKSADVDALQTPPHERASPVADADPAAASASTTAPAPQVIRRVGPSLMAHLIESKCDDGLPIYRQREQFSRYGVSFPLNTLYSYWMAGLRILDPIAAAMLSSVLGSPIVGVDDTRLDFLDPAHRSQKQRGHLWCFVSHGDLVAFDFTETWRAEDIAPRLRAIDGFIQCDDYKGYSAHVDGSPLVDPDRRLGCLMHVRRRFHKAFISNEKDAAIPLSYIKTLYDVEALATERRLNAAGRLQLRQAHSQGPLTGLYAWAKRLRDILRPGSYLEDAVGYALNQRPFIERCFTDGRFALDTGRVERQIREPAIGRKNYLFAGSPEAARLLAGGYSIVCSCHNLGIPTREYLLDVIPRLEAGFPLRRINELRPDQWAVERGILVPADYTAQHRVQ
jgi:transposase